MGEWVEKKLDEVCLKVTDGTHDSPKLLKEGIPFIKGKHISNGYIDFKNCDYISYEDHLKVIKRSKPEIGDILFSNIGTLGSSVYINTNQEFSIKNVALFKPDKNQIIPYFLFYITISPSFQNQMLNKKNGVAQPFITLNELRNFEITIPKSLTTQKKIATILSNYDELIENNNKRIEILEQQAKLIYDEWFVKFKFPNHEEVEFEESELGIKPKDWEIKTFEETFKLITRGITPKYEEKSQIYIINQKVNKGSYLDLQYLKELKTDLIIPKEKYLTKGDILINSLGEGTIGRVHFYNSTNNLYIFDQHMTLCRTESFGLSAYVYFYLSSEIGQKKIESVKTGGTNMTMLNISSLRNFKLYFPNKIILNKFEEKIINIFNLKSSLELKNQNLRKTRDLLLPKLMSGELSTENLNITINEK